MSRTRALPIQLPGGVDVGIAADRVTVKSATAELSLQTPTSVVVTTDDAGVHVSTSDENGIAIAGTIRAILRNMVEGVSKGFVRELELRGVGYRAQMKGDVLSMNLGFSHVIEYPVPAGVSIETPSQTSIVVKGADKQKVGQVAAEIRAFRRPEPYKGKGVRYKDEYVARKEAKKK